MWLVAHYRLFTIVYRANIGFVESHRYHRCQMEPKTLLRLCDCPKSKEIWDANLPMAKKQWFFGLPHDQLHHQNVLDADHLGSAIRTNLEMLFLATVWYLWKAQNEDIFESRLFSLYKVSRQATTFSMDMHITLDQLNYHNVDPVNNCWIRPPPGYYKLNVDGDFLDGRWTYGGLLRDEDELGFEALLEIA